MNQSLAEKLRVIREAAAAGNTNAVASLSVEQCRAVEELIAAAAMAFEMMPGQWAGCVVAGTWKGPRSERYKSPDECPCHMHEKRRAIIAAIEAVG